MSDQQYPRLSRVFRFVISRRWWILGVYAALLAAAIPYALKVEQDNGVDKLIVKDDPDYVLTQKFAEVFGSADMVVLFVEMERPFDSAIVSAVDALDRKLMQIPHVGSNSLVAVYRQSKPDADPTKDPEAFRKFATGSKLFARQGMIGDSFHAVPLILDVRTSEERAATLRAIDEVVAPLLSNPAPFQAVRKVGAAYVNDYLNVKTTEGGMRQFPLFGLFVVLLVVGLYRSFRTLVAFLVAMAVNVALAVGWIGVSGGGFTIVSALVPLTILITCLATLVYIHSRFVEQPDGTDLDEHHVFALSNKFLACTVSIFATAAGFAALQVSNIQPIREMGLWVAIGLLFTWIVSFTLFPALQRVLRTPTQARRKVAAQWFLHVVEWMPNFSYRWRWVTVLSAVALCGAGGVALFGLPGVVSPMKMQSDPIDYINQESQLYKDTRRVEELMPGLSMADLWLQGKVGSMNQPDVIRGLEAFQQNLEAEPLIGSAVSPTTVLRMIRYIGTGDDRLPEDPDELEALTDNFESYVQQNPLLARFVDPKGMSQTHITLVTRINDYELWQELDGKIARIWGDTTAKHPTLAKEFGEGPKVIGLGRLQSKVGHNLVPTLVESFLLTVGIIFSAFLLVFRNGPARLMALIPSLFAILVMFIVMRFLDMSLNVATILIASTVLGTSENDQIHFFYHFLERKKDGTTEDGLKHTMLIAGRSIFFATMINAIGFLAFALSDLPPIRQFAILAAVAFVLSMIADFTALPGALWMVFHDRPGKRAQ